MTNCKEIGYKPIKGADHKHPTYHYEMVPGEAFKSIDGFWQTAKVTKEICTKAEQAFKLAFFQGMTIAEFTVGSDTYAQPIPGEGKAKRAPVEKKAEKSIAAQVREERKAKPPEPAPAKDQPKRAAPPPAPKKDAAPKRAKGLRKGGYGLD